jgi:hypothetical protein
MKKGLLAATLLAIGCGPAVSTDPPMDEDELGDPQSSGTGSTAAGTSGPGPDPATTTLPVTTGPSPDVGIDVDGTYLLAVAAVIDPGHPLQYVAEVERDAEFFDLVLQPLTLDIGSTTAPRLPYGSPLVFTGVPIDDGGCFVLEMGEVFVAGVTNPITGADLVATITLVGCLPPAGFCGNVEGMVHEPLSIDLGGSTFAAVPIRDPRMLPVDFLTSC